MSQKVQLFFAFFIICAMTFLYAFLEKYRTDEENKTNKQSDLEITDIHGFMYDTTVKYYNLLTIDFTNNLVVDKHQKTILREVQTFKIVN